MTSSCCGGPHIDADIYCADLDRYITYGSAGTNACLHYVEACAEFLKRHDSERFTKEQQISRVIQPLPSGKFYLRVRTEFLLV